MLDYADAYDAQSTDDEAGEVTWPIEEATPSTVEVGLTPSSEAMPCIAISIMRAVPLGGEIPII